VATRATITRTNDENGSVSPGAVVQWLFAQGSTDAGVTRPDVNFGVLSVQLVPLLEAAGFATAAAVWVASLKGVAQFGGRVVEIVFARNLRPITVGRIAIGILPPALIILLTGSHSLPLVVAFTLIMGASQGVITIVRGALPLTLFGAGGYGAVLGQIATPVRRRRHWVEHGALPSFVMGWLLSCTTIRCPPQPGAEWCSPTPFEGEAVLHGVRAVRAD
jgi:hypothetical protein